MRDIRTQQYQIVNPKRHRAVSDKLQPNPAFNPRQLQLPVPVHAKREGIDNNPYKTQRLMWVGYVLARNFYNEFQGG